MKIGCCLNMHSTLPDGIGSEWIDVAAESGYDYIELPLAQMMAIDDRKFDALVKKVKDSGICCEASNNFLPAHLKITGNDVNREAVNEYVKRALERAANLGVKVVVFGSGGSRNVPPGTSMDKAKYQLRQFLESLTDLLDEFDINIAIEPLRTAESNIINSLEDASQLMEEIAHPRIGLLSDNFHMSFSGESNMVLSKWSGHILHAHFCRVEGRKIPTGQLEDDEIGYIRKLSLIDSCPRISVEAYSNMFQKDSQEVIALIKNELGIKKSNAHI